jgi:hypothetical protein
MKQLILAIATLGACTDNNVDSTEQARRAYLGLDQSVQNSVQLGFDGFNAASSANIPQQMMPGAATGMLVVTGQVDQGASSNKTMRLNIAMTTYSDGPITVDDKGTKINITYATGATQPFLQLMLDNIPTGTLTGTLTGAYELSGDLRGEVTLDLTIDAHLQAGPSNTVERVPGSTHITGTAVQGDGTYQVDVTL